MSTLRHRVFWPPFLLLVFALILSFWREEWFMVQLTAANAWVLDSFDWLFSWGTLLMVVVCIWVMFSPIGRIRIGGKEAKPLLKRWRWFSIVLCTTVAVGILFWGTAEPMYHFSAPPSSLDIPPNSPQSARFAISTMFLHWSITPYAIYSIPSLVFALAYYNKGQAFSLSSTLYPFTKGRLNRPLQDLLDAVCLYTLVAGMAASLGSGILTLSGGLQHVFGFESGPLMQGLMTILIVTTFCISAASGLMKGIRFLSDINAKIFFGICLFVFITGPSLYILQTLGTGLMDYALSFFQKSTFTKTFSGDSWPQSWTVFYWANWLAWAPITALFLGRIAYGYTVREFMLFNWLIPAAFAIVWMSIFSGTALDFQMNGQADLLGLLGKKGPESVMYAVFEGLPLSNLMISIFLLTAFVSYVTAADSNTEAMGGISSLGITPESPSPPVAIKIVWGITVGAVAWVMVSFAGIEGIKMLSNLGGLPALFLILTVTLGLIRWLIRGSIHS